MGDISTEGCENNSFYNILKTGNFLIPPEQREYVWRPENILRLFDNLKNNYDEGCEDKYYLGAIHTYCESKDAPELFIIDGQQRFTSLCIILFSLFNFMEECCCSENDLEDLIDNRLSFKAEKTYSGEKKYNLRLQAYSSEGNEFLKNLYKNELIYDKTKNYEHINNMMVNADVIKNHIEECFPNKNYKEVHRFMHSILNKTQITHIHNPSRRYALRIFVTLNDSGKKLSAIDLLRAEMFGDDKKEIESISRKWMLIFKTLNNDEKSYTDFLTLYLLSIFGEKSTKIDGVSAFEYVVKTPQNEDSKILQYFNGDNKKMLNDIKDLVFLYKDLKKGYPNNPLHDLALFGLGTNNCWRNFSYIAPFVMAVWRSCPSAELYNEFCQSLRNFIVKSNIISKSENKYNVPKMDNLRIKYISNIKIDKNSAIKKSIEEMNEINGSFETVLKEDLDFNKNKKLTKYLLAKIYHYIEKKAYGQSISVEDLVSKEYDIEHCLPQSEAKHGKNISIMCHSLGNLLLLNMSENRSLKDKSFYDKQRRYMESTFLLNKSMNPEFFKGKKNNNDRIMRTIREYNIQEPDRQERIRINERKDLYIKILKEIFCDNKDVSDEGDVTE